MKQDIQLHDKTFSLYISEEKIASVVKGIATQIEDENNDNPLFIGVLNGAFMFCSDLLKVFNRECEISFIKLASYQGTKSSGKVNELIGLQQDIKNRNIIILEDIIDTGNTIEKIIEILTLQQPKSIKIASLFLKPDVYNKAINIDYVGLNIPNDFIVGYGLDYNGLGRNLKNVYKIL